MNMIGLDILRKMREIKLVPESHISNLNYAKPKSGIFKTIFLDRDGVLIKDRDPIHFNEQPEIIQGTAEAVNGFREMGYSIVVATNQGAIGMGLIDHHDLIRTMRYIRDKLHPVDPWDLAYYSPFYPDAVLPEYAADHPDRKPGPGMLLRAARDMGLNLTGSIMIGDHLKDIRAAHAAGCRGILVTTGRGNSQIESLTSEITGPGDPGYPDAIVQDIRAAFYLLKEGF
jgi:D-glycero-D-manno-heptose 1,7-bisphosphate phosphatase